MQSGPATSLAANKGIDASTADAPSSAPAATSASGVVPVDTAAALAAAFAGDDVAADFEASKGEAAQESVAAVEEPQGLPGWGSWASSKREPKCACRPFLRHLSTCHKFMTPPRRCVVSY